MLGVQATLNPIIQAVYLLQARKSSADVQSTCDMCPDLTPMQICKVSFNFHSIVEHFFITFLIQNLFFIVIESLHTG